MIISEQMLKGCIGIQELDGVIAAVRFTDKQSKVYETEGALSLRSECPSGVYIDIETNSSYIAFDYNIKGWVRNYMYFDIYLNETFVHTVGCEPIKERKGSFYYDIPDTYEFNRITIYLPHLVEIILYGMNVSEGSIVKPVADCNINLLCLGDSITQG